MRDHRLFTSQNIDLLCRIRIRLWNCILQPVKNGGNGSKRTIKLLKESGSGIIRKLPENHVYLILMLWRKHCASVGSTEKLKKLMRIIISSDLLNADQEADGRNTISKGLRNLPNRNL